MFGLSTLGGFAATGQKSGLFVRIHHPDTNQDILSGFLQEQKLRSHEIA